MSDIRFVRNVGSGSYGEVWKAYIKTYQEICAVKKLYGRHMKVFLIYYISLFLSFYLGWDGWFFLLWSCSDDVYILIQKISDISFFITSDCSKLTKDRFSKNILFLFFRQLHHPNVVEFIGTVVQPPELCIITEFCERGSLADILLNESIPLTPTQKLKMMIDSAKGMIYLHGSNPVILHRDLKSDNLLLSKDFDIKVR